MSRKMRQNLLFLGIIVILIILGTLIYQRISMPEKLEKPKESFLQTDKKVVMVIAFQDFRDEEYFVPKGILEKAGIEVKTASNKKGVAIGANGGEARVDFLVSEIKPTDFEAIVFVGGPGCLKNLDNQESYDLAKRTVVENKVLGAICISPVILAKAGFLSGKRATVWSDPLNKKPIEILKENGAIYENKDVVSDGKIITANGPSASQKFGQAIIESLKNK